MREAPHSAFHRQPSASTHEPCWKAGMRRREHALVRQLAGFRLVIERPDLVARAVGEVHRAAVGTEGDAVGHLDLAPHRGRSAIGVDAIEHAARGEIGLGERADPEAPGAVAAAVVEAKAGLVLLRTHQELGLGRADEIDAAGERDQQAAVAPQRDAAGRLGHWYDLGVCAVVALERVAVDVDPPQDAHALVPDRAFTERIVAREHALGQEVHCRRIASMRVADWSLHIYELPYDREVVWSNARERAGLFALLKLTSDSGHTGIAEGTIKHTWSGVSPRLLAAALEDVIVPALSDIDIADDSAMYAALARIPENRLAKALVSNACWTLRAAVAGEPPWQARGGRGGAEGGGG